MSRSDSSLTRAGVSGAEAHRSGALQVRDLQVTFHPHLAPPVTLIGGLDLDVLPGRRLALVGESGSGKSVSAAAIMGLTDYPLTVTTSVLRLGDVDLRGLSAREWRDVRGPQLSLIQQDPLTALSPVFTVGSQVAESIRRHRGLRRSAAWEEAVERLDEVGIPDPRRRAKDYPHQLSGGLRQRVAIAIALAADPSVVFADEPTTALDVTVQAQIIELLRRLTDERDMSLVFITHDLGLLPGFAHDLTVMYSGRVVEHGPAELLLRSSRHPYTKALVEAQPGNSPDGPKRRLATIPGAPPPPSRRPSGCAFAPRCPAAVARCRDEVPQLREVDGRLSACHQAELVQSGVTQP